MNPNSGKKNVAFIVVIAVLSVALIGVGVVAAIFGINAGEQERKVKRLEKKLKKFEPFEAIIDRMNSSAAAEPVLPDDDETDTQLDPETPDTVEIPQAVPSQESEKEFDDIVLDGTYGYGASEYGISFTKDGKVTSGAIGWEQYGTYRTVEKNIIEIHWTDGIDINPDTGEESKSEIDPDYEFEYFHVDGDKLYFCTLDKDYPIIKLD